MIQMSLKTSRVALAASLAAVLVAADGLASDSTTDWPQWRGPNRNDISTETGLLKSWPDDGPKRVWLFRDAGIGYSGPAVVDGTVYTMGGRGRTEHVIAIGDKGKELWSAEVGELLSNGWGDGPRGTPSVDGRVLYALGGRGDLVCVSRSKGTVIWRRAMKDFGGRTPGWGYTESLLVDGNLVVCTPGGRKGAIVALDKRTGKRVWQSEKFSDRAQYSSIIAAEHNGVRQYIQLTMESVAGVAAKDGRLLWRAEWPGRTAVIPTPIFHDGHVYVTSGYGVGCKLLKIGKRNAVEEVYFNRVMKNHHGGVVLLDGHIYGYSDGNGWTCQDFKTGDQVWSEKRELGKGCLTYADGRFYCVDERDGTVALVEATTRGYREHGRFRLSPLSDRRSPRGRIWTHPVISGGKLYLRDQELLFCYDVSSGS